MNGKMALLTLSVFVVGIFAMPNTLSLFSGQHTFSNNGSEPYFCNNCHSDVYDEMNWYSGDAPAGSHGSLTTCKVCHRTGNLSAYGFLDDKGISGSPETNVSSTGAHAAITVECVFCHDMVIKNPGTGEPEGLLNPNEAHNSFYNTANQTALLKGGNEACVGCHTHTRVDINWVRKGGYNITADITGGSWNVSVSLNQTDVNATTSGN